RLLKGLADAPIEAGQKLAGLFARAFEQVAGLCERLTRATAIGLRLLSDPVPRLMQGGARRASIFFRGPRQFLQPPMRALEPAVRILHKRIKGFNQAVAPNGAAILQLDQTSRGHLALFVGGRRHFIYMSRELGGARFDGRGKLIDLPPRGVEALLILLL